MAVGECLIPRCLFWLVFLTTWSGVAFEVTPLIDSPVFNQAEASDAFCQRNSDVLGCQDAFVDRYSQEPQDCPHGDQAEWCTSVPDMHCYVYQDTCCRTCRERRRHGAGCAYGDHVSWCNKHVAYLADCQRQEIAEQCCATCSGFALLEGYKSAGMPNSVKLAWRGCYGEDKASWCPTIERHNCYVSDDVCCESCRQYWTGKPGCEFGDKVDWCTRHITSAESCKDRQMAILCCQSCSQYQ